MNIQKFDANTVGRDFVVGDIHGCYDLLMTEMLAMDFNEATDRLFSVGDLVDRGPDSFKCLNLVFEPWFHAVRGNHEMLMLAGLNDEPRMLDLWLQNGGAWVYEETPSRISGIDAVVCGHTIVTEPVTLGNQHYIDTGAFHTGRLTLIDLREISA